MKTEEKKYRHEYKYPISEIEARIIRERLKAIMPLDFHVGPAGKYVISSLYFDDVDDLCYYDNENGAEPREKFRIRIYNHNATIINLECKRKERSKTLKTSCKLTEEQVRAVIKGEILSVNEDSHPLLKKFVEKQISRCLKPKVIVEYERVPYVYKMGNVRVTFDANLTSSENIDRFLDGDYHKRPIMPKGKLLLEVKYDEFLPDYLYDIMQLNNLTQTAFSKYYLCRLYGTKNKI